MRDYLVIEIRDKNNVKLEVILESFYYESFKDKLVKENKSSKVISKFQYYL